MPLVLDYRCVSCRKQMPETWDSMVCPCGGDYRTTQADSKGWLNYYDENLGSQITSERQRQKLMKKQKVSDFRDHKITNPKVLEAKDKWKFRRARGLA